MSGTANQTVIKLRRFAKLAGGKRTEDPIPNRTEDHRDLEKKPPLSALRRSLKGLRHAEDFRLWTRFVLSPEDTEILNRWARADEETYGILVRRYGECRNEEDRELLLERLQISLKRFAQLCSETDGSPEDQQP